MLQPTNVLLNKSHDLILQEKGYVVVDFLDSETVIDIREFGVENNTDLCNPFYTTHFSTNRIHKGKVNKFILTKIQSSFTNIFSTNFRTIFANFMVKEAGGNNAMPMHADWTYVEEEDANSYSIWIPLIDTNEQNGCLGVIPYSQYLSHKIRGPRILQWNYPTNEVLITKMGKQLSLKAGQAVIYNHKLLHYSPSNNSEKQRAAINISVVPQNKDIIHYSIPEGYEDILKFEVKDDSFFIDYDNFQMPSTQSNFIKLNCDSHSSFDDLVGPFIGNYIDKL